VPCGVYLFGRLTNQYCPFVVLLVKFRWICRLMRL
jgi:hypothetical protein